MTHRSHHRRVHRRSAFTLMEMLVVVAIIVVLAGTGGYLFMQRLEESKVNAARIGIADVERAAQSYYITFQTFPPSIETLIDPAQCGGKAYLDPDKIRDPWGNPYILDSSSLHPTSGKPKVYSQGPGGGEPISNW
jgi:general secretion pathway protein G